MHPNCPAVVGLASRNSQATVVPINRNRALLQPCLQGIQEHATRWPRSKAATSPCNSFNKPPMPTTCVTSAIGACNVKEDIGVNVNVAGETYQQRLQRSKGYPYARPDTSFIFINGRIFTINNNDWNGLSHLAALHGSCEISGERIGLTDYAQQQGINLDALQQEDMWTPVLAIGSNAGPEQLRRKFPNEMFPDGVVVPLLRMHETEGGYNLCRLKQIKLHLAPQAHAQGCRTTAGWASGARTILEEAMQYNHQKGTLLMPLRGTSSSPLAIAEIPGFNRRFPAVTQPQMLALLREALSADTGLGPVAMPNSEDAGTAGDDLDAWIISNIEDDKARRSRVLRIQQHAAQPFQYMHSEIMLKL